MAVPVHTRYEIVFLSNHPLGPKLSHAAVAKAVHCAKSTVKYWLRRWTQTKDLKDSTRLGRPRATTSKQDQRIVSLAEEETFITARDIANKLNRQQVVVSERTVQRRLNEAGAKYNRPMSKPLLTERHRENRLQWAQEHENTNWDQVIFSDETTIRMNSVKGMVWNLPGKKKVVRTIKHPIKVNVWGCFSSKGFGRIVCFKQNLNADYMCKIYQHGLLPTARKQFGSDSMLWKLQEDNDPKHASKIATSWRRERSIEKIDWPSMSPDLAPIENVWQLLKMKLRTQNFKTYESLVSTIKREWKKLPQELAIKLVHSMKNRISEVFESNGDFILR
jgi:transposase